jgi:hypothetical protein
MAVALPRDANAGEHVAPGWPLLVGALMAVALAKELIGSAGRSPAAVKVRTAARRDRWLSLAIALHTLQRVGSSVLSNPGRG